MKNIGTTEQHLQEWRKATNYERLLLLKDHHDDNDWVESVRHVALNDSRLNVREMAVRYGFANTSELQDKMMNDHSRIREFIHTSR